MQGLCRHCHSQRGLGRTGLCSAPSLSCLLLVQVAGPLLSPASRILGWCKTAAALGMCHGSWCVAALIRQAFPAHDGELACCACNAAWVLVELVQVSSSSRPENSPLGPSRWSPGVWSRLVMGWLRCKPGVTLMWLCTSAFTNSVGLLLQGMLSKYPACSTQTLSDPAGSVLLGRE